MQRLLHRYHPARFKICFIQDIRGSSSLRIQSYYFLSYDSTFIIFSA